MFEFRNVAFYVSVSSILSFRYIPPHLRNASGNVTPLSLQERVE